MKKKIIEKTVMFIMIVLFITVFKSIFGVENSIVGVAGITVALTLLCVDYTINPLRNTIKFVLIEVGIGAVAFIGSLNPITALIMTFAVYFFILYYFTYDAKKAVFFPFILAYIFMLYYKVDLNRLPMRIMSLAACGILIMVLQLLINRNTFSKSLNARIKNQALKVKEEIEYIFQKRDIHQLTKENIDIETSLVNLMDEIYSRGEQEFYETKIGEVELNILIALKSLNVTLYKIALEVDKNKNIDLYEGALRGASDCIDSIYKCLNGEIDVELLKLQLSNFEEYNEEYAFNRYLTYEIKQDFQLLLDSVNDVEFNKKDFYNRECSIHNKWVNIKSLKFKFSRKSLRFSFALRGAILASISACIINYFNLETGRWFILTLSTLILPYVEESKTKAIKRLKGTVIGIIIFEITFMIIPSTNARVLLILLVGYLSTFPEQYDYKMIYVTISALGAVAVGTEFTHFAVDRFLFIIGGIIVALLGNKYLLPYKIVDSTKELIKNSIDLDKKILKDIFLSCKDEAKKEEIKELMICNRLINEEIAMNNQILNKDSVKNFLNKQRISMNNVYFLFKNLSEDSSDNLKGEEIAKEVIYAIESGEHSIKDYIVTRLKEVQSNSDILVLINLEEIFNMFNESLKEQSI